MTKNQKKLYYSLGAAGILLAIGIVSAILVSHFANQNEFELTNVANLISDNIMEIDWSSYPKYTLTLSDDLEITDPGVYTLSGEIPDGCITIDTDANIKLILDNVRITHLNGPAIYVANADNVVISTTLNSKNYLTDGESYNGYDDSIDGAIFSHDDLLLEGEGALILDANYADGIVSKDGLTFNGGTYQIASVDDGIRGKDSVYISAGDFNITAGGDGIKSTNDTESNHGFIYVTGGSFDISAELDGIQAETILQIAGGDFKFQTGGGSSITSTSENWGSWGRMPMESQKSTIIDTASAKGIKATDIIIEQGTFDFDCSDDAIHANSNLKLAGGDITLASGDDGLHADQDLVISDTNLRITKSYEGIEGSTVTINSGQISIMASDDGINGAGGSDASAMNRPGANQFQSDDNIFVRIAGGEIEIDSSGDSIDSNGNLYITGGNLKIAGPTNGADNALDHSGELIITGGTILSSEISGMIEGGISNTSTNYSLVVTFRTSYAAGTTVSIMDSDGQELMSLRPSKSFNSITFSSPELQANTTYQIKINSTVYQSFTISSVTTQIGTSSNMNPGGGMQGGPQHSSNRPL